MTLANYIVSVTLTEINCGKCGGTYAINERYRALKAEEGGGWKCPYCECSWGYYDNNENARLKRELKQERKRKEWAENDARQQRERAERWQRKEQGQRAAKSRIKNRVVNGVCPCCRRSFLNLARHMKGQHPSWKAND